MSFISHLRLTQEQRIGGGGGANELEDFRFRQGKDMSTSGLLENTAPPGAAGGISEKGSRDMKRISYAWTNPANQNQSANGVMFNGNPRRGTGPDERQTRIGGLGGIGGAGGGGMANTIMEIPDIIDIRLLMSSKDELVLPRDEIFTPNDIRSLVITPYLFPLIEYFSIFFFCGIIRLVSAPRVSIVSNWNATVGAIYMVSYLSVFLVDVAIFISRNIKLFNYTLFTLLLRVFTGTVALLYLSILVNGFFTYYRKLG